MIKGKTPRRKVTRKKSTSPSGIKSKIKKVTKRNGVTKSTTIKKKTYSNPRRAIVGSVLGGVAAAAMLPAAVVPLGIAAGAGVGSFVKKRLSKTKKSSKKNSK